MSTFNIQTSMKKYVLLSILIAASTYQITMAQSFDDLVKNSGKNLYTDGLVKIFFQQTNVTGTFAEPESMPTLSMGLRRESADKNGLRWSWEYPALGYAVNLLYRALKSENLTPPTEKLFTSGLAGWHKVSVNVLATDRLLISPGVSVGDHMISTTLRSSRLIIDAIGHENYNGGAVQSIDPAGYYLYAGPSLIASYVVNSKIWVDAYANYDFTVVKVSNPSNNYVKNPDYPMPTVSMYGADVHTTYGVFAGVRLASQKDNGAYKNEARRVDISVGYQF